MSVIYTAPPTLASFMKSEAFGRIAAGPVGSGKTTACLIEILAPLDGTSQSTRWLSLYSLGCCSADSEATERHGSKRRSVLVRGPGRMAGSRRIHITSTSRDVQSELVFIPLENAEDQARLLSMQLTGAWLSEAIEMNFDVLAPVSRPYRPLSQRQPGRAHLVRHHRRHQHASRTSATGTSS